MIEDKTKCSVLLIAEKSGNKKCSIHFIGEKEDDGDGGGPGGGLEDDDDDDDDDDGRSYSFFTEVLHMTLIQ